MDEELHYNKYGVELVKVAPEHQCEEHVPYEVGADFYQCSRKGTFRTTGKRPMYLCTQHANRYYWATDRVKRKEQT